MQFEIDANALAFLKEEHNSALMLRTSPRHGCCGGTVWLPVLEPGAPEDGEGWPFSDVQGVRVYLEPGLEIPEEAIIRIGLDTFLKWKKLWVEGVDIQPGGTKVTL